jgi:hypothetical protein
MRNFTVWLLSSFVLLLIQGGILLPLRISPVNLILVVVAMAVILSDFNQGLLITVMGGLLLDFTSGLPDGLISISLLVAFLILHFIMNEILSREPNRFILFSAVLAASIIYFIAFLAVDKLFGFIGLASRLDIRYILVVQLPLTVLWNSIFAYPIFRYYLITQNLASKLPTNEQPIRSS